jgi:hypothetical protein
MMSVSLMSLKLVLVVILFCPNVTSSCRHWRLELDGVGNTLFLSGDRRFRVPSNVSQVDSEYCKRNLQAIDDLRNITRKCLTPFVTLTSGLMTFGFRKTVRKICSDSSAKRQLVQRVTCLHNNTNKQVFDSSMPALILKLEFVRNTGKNTSHMLLQACCLLDSYFTVSSQRHFIADVSHSSHDSVPLDHRNWTT